MFLRFAVAFLEYSENLHLIRGGKKKRVPENKKHQSETVYICLDVVLNWVQQSVSGRLYCTRTWSSKALLLILYYYYNYLC